MITIDQKSPAEIRGEIASRVRARRKEHGFTQEQMARRAGMSLGSYRRFEQKGLVELASLVNIAIALDCEDDFDALFARKSYRSIQEVIDESRNRR